MGTPFEAPHLHVLQKETLPAKTFRIMLYSIARKSADRALNNMKRRILMKDTTLKRVLSLVLALVLTLSAFPILGLPASADVSWPWLSASNYCEYVSPGKTTVYLDSGLTTPGASGRAYNAYIAGGDTLKIYEITGSYTYLSYPTSKGSKTGYVKTSSIFGVSAPNEQVTSRGKATTYKTPSTSSRSGYVASGDKVYKLGSTKSGYTLVMYTAASGSRAYKVAFVKASDYDNIIIGSSGSGYVAPSNSGSSSQLDVGMRLRSITRGNLRLNDGTDLEVGHTFSGTNAKEQCKGYARNLFKMCFGVNVGSTRDNNYTLNSVNGVSLVGTVTDMNEQNVSSLFKSARTGDFVQMRRSHGGPHSMILFSADDGGVYVFEANTDGRNTIMYNHYTWADLCQKNSAMSVYTASNYTLT